jgi:cell division protein FtsQ
MNLAEEESPPLPGELDLEEESPYLRRQKAVAVRRGHVAWRWRRALGAMALLLPVSMAGYFLATFALTSPRFVLNSADCVTVAGNHFVSREEILNALGLPLGAAAKPGVNVFRLLLDAKRQQLESIAWVQSASVTRVLPNRLAVRVVERTPVAFVNLGGRVSLVDNEGILLEKPENASFDFPVLTGLDAAQNLDARRARLALYQEFRGQLDPEAAHSGWVISEVDLADPDDLKALLVQDRETILVHFGHQDFLERFHSFLALLPELRKSDRKLDSVDLRYRNQIVVNPEPSASTQRGEAAGSSGALKE